MSGERATAGRSVYLDALRAVALVRVVVYHATGAWWLTAFTAMPLMFFIAGSLFASSLDRRSAAPVIRDRYRRILLPYWVYLVPMVGLWASLGLLGELDTASWIGLVLPVLSTDGVRGPGADTAVHLTWFALWYLQMHLVLSLLGPLLRRAQRSRPGLTWAAVGIALVASLPVAPALTIAIFYGACWLVGYHHHDGHLDRFVRERWVPAVLVLGPLGAVAFFGFHSSAVAVAAIGVVLLAGFWLLLALGLQPRIEPVLQAARPRAVVSWFSRRSLTVYLWHGAVLYVAVTYLPGAGTPIGDLLWCVVLLPVAALGVGWVEDIAARRPPQLWPHRPRAGRVVDLRDGGGAPRTGTGSVGASDRTPS